MLPTFPCKTLHTFLCRTLRRISPTFLCKTHSKGSSPLSRAILTRVDKLIQKDLPPFPVQYWQEWTNSFKRIFPPFLCNTDKSGQTHSKGSSPLSCAILTRVDKLIRKDFSPFLCNTNKNRQCLFQIFHIITHLSWKGLLCCLIPSDRT